MRHPVELRAKILVVKESQILHDETGSAFFRPLNRLMSQVSDFPKLALRCDYFMAKTAGLISNLTLRNLAIACG